MRQCITPALVCCTSNRKAHHNKPSLSSSSCHTSKWCFQQKSLRQQTKLKLSNLPCKQGFEQWLGHKATHDTHSKHVLLHFVNVHLAWHALHEDVPDVPQNGPCCQHYQDCKDECTDGVCQLPFEVVLQSKHAPVSALGLLSRCIMCYMHGAFDAKPGQPRNFCCCSTEPGLGANFVAGAAPQHGHDIMQDARLHDKSRWALSIVIPKSL